jgi:uncharacterized protein YbaR (Trm112 family)
MHILLTDVITCPHCGPSFGLVVLVDELADRRVREGWLACANCRERYRISAGVADLRAAGEPLSDGGAVSGADAERLAALAGVARGPGYLLLAGSAGAQAATIAALLEDVHVIAAVADAAGVPEHAQVTRVRVARALPFYSGRIAGVVLGGVAASALLEEGARVLSPVGRLVLDGAPPDAAARVERAGLRVAAATDDVLVAVRR